MSKTRVEDGLYPAPPHPALAQTPQEHERFYNEARIATQLDHGRIVKVIDISEVQGSPCLVMEWVDGVNLREFIEKVGARLDLDVCLFIIGEILTAFVYAHERKVAGADAPVPQQTSSVEKWRGTIEALANDGATRRRPSTTAPRSWPAATAT